MKHSRLVRSILLFLAVALIIALFNQAMLSAALVPFTMLVSQ